VGPWLNHGEKAVGQEEDSFKKNGLLEGDAITSRPKKDTLGGDLRRKGTTPQDPQKGEESRPGNVSRTRGAKGTHLMKRKGGQLQNQTRRETRKKKKKKD